MRCASVKAAARSVRLYVARFGIGLSANRNNGGWLSRKSVHSYILAYRCYLAAIAPPAAGSMGIEFPLTAARADNSYRARERK